MFRAVPPIASSPGPSLPLLRRGLGTRLLLEHVSGTPKSAVKFSVSSGTIFAGSQNPHNFVEIVLGKLFFSLCTAS